MSEILEALLQDTPGEASEVLSATLAGARRVDASSPTVLAVDRWGLRRGQELAEQWAEADIAKHRPEVVADAHAALFEPLPTAAPTPAEQQRSAWWQQLMDSPEYRSLHVQTCLDGALSELASKNICDQWQEFFAAHPEPEDPECPLPGSDREPISETLARMRSTAKALMEAGETVQAARDLAGGLGIGGEGEPLDARELAEYFKRLRDDSFLRELMTLAGRMRTLCQALQRTKTAHGRDDTVGVELGGDIARLVPSELAQLACGIPELELLALDRVARRQALCRQYRGLERLGRGPIVVVVDESGSMSGERILAAKALALALAWLARRQKRWIALVGFSGDTGYNRVAFPPGRTDQVQLLSWLTHFFGRGSDRDVPIKELPEDWPALKAEGLPEGRTDVIMITDAVVQCSDELRNGYLAWARTEQVRTYGIVTGRGDAGDLAALTDRHWCIPSLDLDSDAVEAVLSI